MKQSFDMRRILGGDNNIIQLIVITVLVFALMTWMNPTSSRAITTSNPSATSCRSWVSSPSP